MTHTSGRLNQAMPQQTQVHKLMACAWKDAGRGLDSFTALFMIMQSLLTGTSALHLAEPMHKSLSVLMKPRNCKCVQPERYTVR